jgi:hypothetical protein
LNEFDVLLFANMSRASRDTLDMLVLLRMLDSAGKRLVILDPPFDSFTATEMDRSMLVFRTEMNRMQRVDTIKNVQRQVKRDRQLGKYLGGRVPFWLMVVPHKGSDDGWQFVLSDNPKALELAREVVRRVLNNEGLGMIAADLNARNEPTPEQLRVKRRAVRPRKASEIRQRYSWSVSGIRAIARNRMLIGQREIERYKYIYVDGKRRKVVLAKYLQTKIDANGNDTGIPIEYCPQLITPKEYAKVQVIVNTPRRKVAQTNRSDLYDVCYCLTCGCRLYQSSPDKKRANYYSYYYCPRRRLAKACDNKPVSYDLAQNAIEAEVQQWRGRRVYLPEETQRQDFDSIIAKLRADQEIEVALGKLAQTEESRRLRLDNFGKLETQISEFEEEKIQASDKDYIPTGLTFGELWDSMTWRERGDFLRQCGIRFEFGNMEGKVLVLHAALPKDIDAIFADVATGRVIVPGNRDTPEIAAHAAMIAQSHAAK